MKATPRIHPMKSFGRDGVLIQAPYDEVVLEQLKAMVPSEARRWNERLRGWWVRDDYADIAVHLILEAFGSIGRVDESGESVLETASGERWRQERLF